MPKFFDVTTDPCEHNPFHPADPRHSNWKRDTRRAEEELAKVGELMPAAYHRRLDNEWARVESELLKYGQPLSPISMAPLLVPFYRGKFDVWAWRALAAIASDEDLNIYDRWLTKHASDWLELLEGSDSPEEMKRPVIDDLHKSLLACIPHWQSEARKYLRSQQETGIGQVATVDSRDPAPHVYGVDASFSANPTPQLAADSQLVFDLVHFQYQYPEDLDSKEQAAIEAVRSRENERFKATPIHSFEGFSAAKADWLQGLAAGAFAIFGRAAAMSGWSPNRRREEFRRYVGAAAAAGRLTQPALQIFYNSHEWKSLDDALFPDAQSCSTSGGDDSTCRTSIEDDSAEAGEPRRKTQLNDMPRKAEQQSSPEASSSSQKSMRVFRKAGAVWTVSFGDETVQIKDARGMGYICELLRVPRQLMHSFQLLSAAAGQSSEIQLGSAGPVLDEAAVSAYRNRMEDIENRLTVAEGNGDSSQKESLMDEKARLEAEALAAVGFDGKVRDAHDDTEKVRKSVSNAISRAISNIRAYNPAAADHLRRHINRGQFVVYEPDDIDWEF